MPSDTRPPVTEALAPRLTAAMAEIHRRGWCDGTGGNFSCVVERDPLHLLMAPSGVHKGQVAPADLISVDHRGQVIAGAGKASAETALHLEIITSCGAGAVLHTHSQAGTLLSNWVIRNHGNSSDPGTGDLVLADLEMLKGLEGFTTHAMEARIPVLANDQDLPRLAAKARARLRDAPHGLLIAGHGLYAWGRDLDIAMRHLEILEFLLEQRWRELLLEAVIQGAAR